MIVVSFGINDPELEYLEYHDIESTVSVIIFSVIEKIFIHTIDYAIHLFLQ